MRINPYRLIQLRYIKGVIIYYLEPQTMCYVLQDFWQVLVRLKKQLLLEDTLHKEVFTGIDRFTYVMRCCVNYEENTIGDPRDFEPIYEPWLNCFEMQENVFIKRESAPWNKVERDRDDIPF